MGKNTKKEFVIVTGGTSGIGYAAVCHFLKNGYGVVVMYGNDTDRALTKERELVEQGYVSGEDFFFVHADVSKTGILQEALSSIEAIRDQITVLINNAGMLKRAPFEELQEEDWHAVFGVNVFGIAHMSQWLHMECPNARVIINIGSIRGFAHVSRLNNMIYSVSKACIPTLTAVLAKQLGPAIRVVGILPGTIDTPQRQGITEEEFKMYGEDNTIQGRLGTPEEVADLCLFIASERARYITGTSITIDGGYSVNYIK
ncbi:MAG TPA: SDR family oxidoreductase [Candidatus Paceibacterota bacterium]|nr:SDR family oxidoreductase [Candidatus Paceibacterota bacterium]